MEILSFGNLISQVEVAGRKQGDQMIDISWKIIGIYLLSINVLTFLLFAFDKRRARRRQWRISERTLLLACLLGGTIGAYWARGKFRHKTQKQPFSTLLHGISVLQILAIAASIWLGLSDKYM